MKKKVVVNARGVGNGPLLWPH